MKKRYYLITAVVAYLVFSIAGLPANTVYNFLGDKIPHLKMYNVSGTLWNGNAKKMAFKSKHSIENVNWSFSGWRLFTGAASFNINGLYNKRPIQSLVGIDLSGKLFARSLTTSLDAKTVGELAQLPFAELSGTILVNLDSLSWKQGNVPQASGELNWENATITAAESVNLGKVNILLADTDTLPLTASLSNAGGQLSLEGNAQLTDEAEYEYKVKLTPTKDASSNLKNSLPLFATKQTDGSFLSSDKGHLKQLGIM